MKRTVLVATVMFWCLMIGVVIAGRQRPMDATNATNDQAAQVAQVAPLAQAPAAKQYTLKDVMTHATAKDCWMAIGGKVYDFSAYIPQHPSAPEVMTRHCGKEATRAFETKDLGRPHSDYAKSLLAKFLIGALRE